MQDNEKKAREAILKKSDSSEYESLPKIKGYDFNKAFDFNELIKSYETMGFQATHFAKAIRLVKKMRKEGCLVYLGYTSSMVTSGLRDIFRYLAEHKLVDVIVTTAGAVEEDFVKSIAGDFLLGSFKADGKMLREKGINRTGNIFVPNERYCKFEDFFIPVLDKLKKEKKIFGSLELIDALGKEVADKKSIYYWCHKNKIPVFCPAITDGSMGDMIYFYSINNPDLKIDVVNDLKTLHDMTLKAKKTGLIILGSGLIKHHILNTNLMRNGADYTVYINDNQEFDGSDSGARPDEAVSWGKLIPGSDSVKVYGDALILFPLLVAAAFKDKE
jgi:deoxyhypusine synthase